MLFPTGELYCRRSPTPRPELRREGKLQIHLRLLAALVRRGIERQHPHPPKPPPPAPEAHLDPGNPDVGL